VITASKFVLGEKLMKNFLLASFLALAVLLVPHTAAAQAPTCTGGNLHCAQLSWSAGSGGGAALGYNVYRSTTSGGCAVVTSATCHLTGSVTVPSLTYLDQPLAPSTTYFWVVTATNLSAFGAPQESAPSAEVTAATGPDPINVPASPTGVTVVAK
jgi:hypothetical protein